MADDRSALTTLLTSAHPGGTVTVGQVTRLSAGASRRTLLVHAVVDGTPVTDVVQVDQGAPPGGGDGRAGMATQAELLRRAAAAGVPVPPVLAVDTTGVLGGPAVVMAAVEGETIARRILRDDAYAAARAGFSRDCGRALAALHAVDPDGLGLSTGDPLVGLRASLDAAGEHRPTFELALRWLDTHRPPMGAPTLVHGDFRLGNLIVGPDGVRAVLDWELAHLGDPMEDLGWLCSVAWRFGGAEPVGGVGRRDDLYRAYEAAGGRPVDRAAAHWWEVRAALSWGIICMGQARRHLSGTTPSMELAAIGRRVPETECDLFGLLWPDAWRAALAAPGTPAGDPDPAGGLHGRPTAAELAEAVAGWLSTDVAAAVPQLAFHLRVAGNVLATVAREARLGAGQAAAHTERLARLGAADDADLVGRLRAGSATADTPGLLDAVAADVRDRLAVANPRYLDRPALEAPGEGS
ncbi:MAG TPA: phosphotransferase family protein [Acidimicrobiales bacterium]|nr:phosphotransferase family protein [Acidimicrobiales bacterium]